MTNRQNASGERFLCVRLVVDAETLPDAAERQEAADHASGECFAAGAAGIEERSGAHGITLLIYASASVLNEVLAAGTATGARPEGEPQEVAPVDWSQTWKAGFEAIEVSDRLVVRPSFVAFEARSGQREIVIDPGQAFGTGGHASTGLVLEWVDALRAGFDAQTRVLDVGTGTGVLALSALALGAGSAVGFDLDPVAAIEARAWGERNGLAERFAVYAGGIEALAAEPFDLVLANLLRRELLAIAAEVARCTRPGGLVVLSGLLAEERDEVEAVMARLGLESRGERFVRDATGDHWMSLLMAAA